MRYSAEIALDGHPAHKAAAVKAFVEKHKDRLRVFYLPGYSPDLNPDEWVWRNLKVHGTGRQSIAGPDHLHALVTKTMRSLQRRPEAIRSFFKDAGGGYAA